MSSRRPQRRKPSELKGLCYLEDLQVVGGFYHQMWEAKMDGELSEGMNLVLKPEPHNMHDHNAIAVYTPSGTMLGYIPREKAAVYAPIMRCGIEFHLRMVTYVHEPRRINARMYVTKPK